MMDAEAFDAWLKDPVTKMVFAGMKRAAEQEKAEWLRLSWDEGQNDPVELAKLKASADAFNALRFNTFEEWKSWND